MSIAGMDSVSSNGNPLYGTSNVLAKEDFLKLLVAQLQAQDPLKPMESTEFTAQLAQFSSLEQLSNINDNLQYLQLYQSSINNAQAVAFIGKNVEAIGNSIQLTNGVSDDMLFDLASDANAVFINIFDSSGKFIKAIESGPYNAGEQSIAWDGTDKDGNNVSDGEYDFEVVATDANGDEIQTTTFITAAVTGVTFIDGTTYLLAGDKKIPVGNVIKVHGG